MIVKHIRKHGAWFSVYLLAFLCLKLEWWIDRNFGSPTFEQILFHLQFGSDGLFDTDPRLVRGFVVHCMLAPFLFACGAYFIQWCVLSRKTTAFIEKFHKQEETSLTARCCQKLLMLLQRSFVHFVPVAILGLGMVLLASKLAIWSYLKTYEETRFYEEHYVEPTSVVPPEKKKNLILIYVESLENGFSNSVVMGKDLLAPIEAATPDAYSFKDYESIYGTDWTMAGFVSTQCGIPLKTLTGFTPNLQGEKLKSFLPGATCLGDILKKNGYENVFLQGASVNFSGTEKFYSQHGYTTIKGREFWAQKTNRDFEDFEFWGLNDADLFSFAKVELDALYQSGKPFNLTLATVDTHAPTGFVNPVCKARGVVDYKGVVNCTASLVAEFVEYIKRRSYLENTVVVVVGDHLAMEVPVLKELKAAGQRTVFNRIVTNEKLVKNTERIYAFSMFPTILYTLGFRFEDNRLALGASGFGPSASGYKISNLPPRSFSELLVKASRRYNQFHVDIPKD